MRVLQIFDLQKWNYLNSNKYQRGYSWLFWHYRKVISIQFQKKLNLDMYLGGATSQGFITVMIFIDGQRYEPKTLGTEVAN